MSDKKHVVKDGAGAEKKGKGAEEIERHRTVERGGGQRHGGRKVWDREKVKRDTEREGRKNKE
jgi:hypothetical protein